MRKYQLRLNEIGDGFYLFGEALPHNGVFYHKERDAISYAKSANPQGCVIEFLDKWGQLIRIEEH